MTTRGDPNEHSGRDKRLVYKIMGRSSFQWSAWNGVAAVTIRVTTICAIIGIFPTASTFAQDRVNGHRLVVAEFAWTNAIHSDGDIDRRIVNRDPVAPIVLWTRVHGANSALESLRKEDRLPIRHVWFVNCGSRYRFDELIDPIDVIDLGSVSTGTVIQQLQTEVDNRGYFDWRTWSRKESVSTCWYTVRIVDNQDSPLYCEEIKADCELTIKLGN